MRNLPEACTGYCQQVLSELDAAPSPKGLRGVVRHLAAAATAAQADCGACRAHCMRECLHQALGQFDSHIADVENGPFDQAEDGPGVVRSELVQLRIRRTRMRNALDNLHLRVQAQPLSRPDDVERVFARTLQILESTLEYTDHETRFVRRAEMMA
jgi:hypothetical protein